MDEILTPKESHVYSNKMQIDTTVWAEELNVAITVADLNGTIFYMNKKSKLTYPNTKTGDNLSGCHKKSSMDKIDGLVINEISNTYTVTRNGIKKFIHQTPWYIEGVIGGLVEFSVEVPNDFPHIDRDKGVTSPE